MHDIEDYQMAPEQAAQIANQARVKLLVFYHLLPAPDGYLARSVFGRASMRRAVATGRLLTTAVCIRCRLERMS
jgi:ribonuclease BN (tRNA processing enzyme)